MALAGGAVLLLGFAALAPFAAKPLHQVNGFIPALDATICVTDLVTASLLMAHFSVTRSRGLLVVACGYFSSALIVAAHGVTFPGAFFSSADLGHDLRVSFRIYVAWHVCLPATLLAYLWLRDERNEGVDADWAPPSAVAGGVVGVLVLTAFIVWLAVAGDEVLPSPLDTLDRTSPLAPWLTASTMLLIVSALGVLWARRRSSLDQWLVIAALASAAELGLTALLGGLGPVRFTLGFYSGRVFFSLVTSTVVLAALLMETTNLYARVASANLLASIASASRSLSLEIELLKVVERLIQVAIEHSRADRALLILPSGNEFSVRAEGQLTDGHINVALRQEPISAAVCSEAVVRHVIAAKATVVVTEPSSAEIGGPFSKDVARGRKQPASTLCLPLLRQDLLSGVLYLESTTARNFFTPERTRLLELLASQAAISLANATLYSDLRRSEAFLAQGQHVSRTGSFGWSLANETYHWSEESYKILEYEQDVSPSLELALQRIHPDDRELVSRGLHAAMDEKRDFNSEHRLLMPDGRIKYVHVTGRALTTGALDFVGAVHDVTERTLAEEESRRARGDLAHVARVATLNAMTASIGHEVTQPLAGILTNANTCVRMLAAEPPDLVGAEQTARRTIRDANRATEVIKRLRAMFSTKASNREISSINDLAREVVAMTTAEVRRHGAILRTDFGDALPAVSVDRIQLQQVILNLLLNAADAMSAVVGRTKTILMRTGFDETGCVWLSVRDSGIGIEVQDAEKLFQPFYSTKAAGLGVGLSISRSIIQYHEGRIWAEPNDGPGVTFTFCIPAGAAHASDESSNGH